jgi:hypothetical protein
MGKCLILVTSLLALTATSEPTWAFWGCGYRYSGLANGRHGSVAGFESQKAAQKGAIRLCEGSGHRGCHVVGCAPNVDTLQQARAIWPLGGIAGHCLKNGHIVASTSGSCD